MTKKLYLISQDVNNGWDTFDSAVVCAKSKKDAQWTLPGFSWVLDKHYSGVRSWDGEVENYSSWCNVKDVKVKYIGVAAKSLPLGVVCASFNAG